MPEATTQIEVREPTGKVRRISDGRLNRAARELNLLNVSARGLHSVATIGQFLDQVGLLRYGNGRLLGSSQMIYEAAIACAAQANRDGIADEVRQGYLDLQLRFVKALDENVALQIELNKVAETRSANPNMPQGKPFLPGAQISPIQILVQGGTVEKTANAEEEPCRK